MSELYHAEYQEAYMRPPEVTIIEDIRGEELDREAARLRRLPFQQLLDEYLSMGNE